MKNSVSVIEALLTKDRFKQKNCWCSIHLVIIINKQHNFCSLLEAVIIMAYWQGNTTSYCTIGELVLEYCDYFFSSFTKT